MSYNIYSAPHELTSPQLAKALHCATGYNIYNDQMYRDGGWMGFGSPWNWHTLQYSQSKGNDFVYLDHAYFNRHKYYRVTKNAYFHDGSGQTNHSRIRKFYRSAQPWRKGRYIIIAPQSEEYFLRIGMNQADWIQGCIDKIKKYSDRPIGIHYKRDRKPLRDMLKTAWLLVSHTSNSSLEAIMHGVPTICTGLCHVTPMATKGFENIEKPFYPDNRMDWAGVLADNQFTLDEIKEGLANAKF